MCYTSGSTVCILNLCIKSQCWSRIHCCSKYIAPPPRLNYSFSCFCLRRQTQAGALKIAINGTGFCSKHLESEHVRLSNVSSAPKASESFCLEQVQTHFHPLSSDCADDRAVLSEAVGCPGHRTLEGTPLRRLITSRACQMWGAGQSKCRNSTFIIPSFLLIYHSCSIS